MTRWPRCSPLHHCRGDTNKPQSEQPGICLCFHTCLPAFCMVHPFIPWGSGPATCSTQLAHSHFQGEIFPAGRPLRSHRAEVSSSSLLPGCDTVSERAWKPDGAHLHSVGTKIITVLPSTQKERGALLPCPQLLFSLSPGKLLGSSPAHRLLPWKQQHFGSGFVGCTDGRAALSN